MGPDGPIPAPDLRLGLLFQRPDSYYPLHNHDADETYVILAGEAHGPRGRMSGCAARAR
ncbi:MAG: dimethylsulfonioproprionate lyase family protein [Defluviimonas denitrificans]